MFVNQNPAPYQKKKEVKEPYEALYSSKSEEDRCLSRFFQGIHQVLTDVKFCPVPSVHAAPVEKRKARNPERPPPMKPSELPIYSHPHESYKSFVEEKDLGKTGKTKVFHDILSPYVKDIRLSLQSLVTTIKKDFIVLAQKMIK